MRKSFFSPLRLFAMVSAIVAGLSLGGMSVAAQATATPVDVGHPAHIHDGTCENLGSVVYPLNNVGAPEVTVSPTDAASPPAALETTPIPDEALGEEPIVAESTTMVDASLDDILAAEHAINVHESPENIQEYIACGDITGEPTDGMLEITLQELNDSGFSGGATLMDNGDGTTTVVVTLTQEDASGTPEATPAS